MTDKPKTLDEIRDKKAEDKYYIGATERGIIEGSKVSGALALSKKLTNRDRYIWKEGFDAGAKVMELQFGLVVSTAVLAVDKDNKARQAKKDAAVKCLVNSINIAMSVCRESGTKDNLKAILTTHEESLK